MFISLTSYFQGSRLNAYNTNLDDAPQELIQKNCPAAGRDLGTEYTCCRMKAENKHILFSAQWINSDFQQLSAVFRLLSSNENHAILPFHRILEKPVGIHA